MRLRHRPLTKASNAAVSQHQQSPTTASRHQNIVVGRATRQCWCFQPPIFVAPKCIRSDRGRRATTPSAAVLPYYWHRLHPRRQSDVVLSFSHLLTNSCPLLGASTSLSGVKRHPVFGFPALKSIIRAHRPAIESGCAILLIELVEKGFAAGTRSLTYAGKRVLKSTTVALLACTSPDPYGLVQTLRR